MENKKQMIYFISTRYECLLQIKQVTFLKGIILKSFTNALRFHWQIVNLCSCA